MSKVVRVQDGDYKIVVGSEGSPGNITLDTNPAGELGQQGKVIITGDLEVLGNTTVVQSETLAVKDNIIVVNAGEQLEGVQTLGFTAGVTVDRGGLSDVSLLWDERTDQFIFVNDSYRVPTDLPTSLQGIATNRIDTGGSNLTLITRGTGVVTVSGTVNYEQQILDYTKLSAIYNISAISCQNGTVTITTSSPHGFAVGELVDVFVLNNSAYDIFSGQITSIPDAGPNASRFTYFKPSLAGTPPNPNDIPPGTPATGTVRPYPIRNDDAIPNIKAIVDYTNNKVFSTNKIQEGDTKVQVYDTSQTGFGEIIFDVDLQQRVVVNNAGMTIDSIRVNTNNISNIATRDILVDSAISLQNVVSNYDPLQGYTSGYVKLYSKDDVGGGGTGLYFVNTEGTNDELISKRRAIVYSLIF